MGNYMREMTMGTTDTIQRNLQRLDLQCVFVFSSPGYFYLMTSKSKELFFCYYSLIAFTAFHIS